MDKIVVRLSDELLRNNELFVGFTLKELKGDAEVIVDSGYSALLSKNNRFTGPLAEGKYFFRMEDVIDADIMFISASAELPMHFNSESKLSDVTESDINLIVNGTFTVAVEYPIRFYRSIVLGLKANDTQSFKRIMPNLIAHAFLRSVGDVIKTHKLATDMIAKKRLSIEDGVSRVIAEDILQEHGLKLVAFTLDKIIAESLTPSLKNHKESGKPYCPNCDRCYSEAEQYCSVCGERLLSEKYKCPNCGTVNICGAVFCSNCGEKIGEKED